MKAIIISRPGGPDVLEQVDRPQPNISPSQVLVRVAAAGINRADLAQRAGNYPPPPGASPDIPGLEISGIVEACGAEVKRWRPGDAVCALLAGGGYAEYVAVEATHCLPIPQGITLTDAAGLPETTFTVWSNVFQRGQLKPGERFLIHGGSSGIGFTAIQLAHARGAYVVATAGSDEKCAACQAMGADQVINYRKEDFAAVLATDGVDVILDMVGGEYVAKNLSILRPDGRLVFINGMAGAKADFNIHQVMTRRLTITGSTLRSRDKTFKADLAAAVEAHVWPLVASGKCQPNVTRRFPYTDAAAAHRWLESGENTGKVVLTFTA